VIPTGRSLPNLRAGLAAAILLAVAFAACSNATPTPSPTPSPTRTALPTISPTPTPTISIVPVPTPHLAAQSAPAAHLDETKANALQAALNGIRTSGKYPGVSAAILFPDGSLWAGVSGVAITSKGTPVTTDTLFSVGSITKTFVAALIGRLARIGTIGLDDPLARYVPDFPNAANIAIRQLLNHTSGIRDLFEVLDTAILANPAATWTVDQVLAHIGKPYFEPGTDYHYSNTDYVLLGLVIEKATGRTVGDLVRAAFLTPLALNHTYLQTEEEVQGAKAHGYMPTGGVPRDNSAGTMLPFTAEATAASFAGAYVSTASDLAVWADALYGGRVLDEATLAAMADVTASRAGPHKPLHLYGYGLGFEETTIAGQVGWGHQGHLDGFWSAMEYVPAYNVTIVVLTNAEWADPIAAASALGKVALA